MTSEELHSRLETALQSNDLISDTEELIDDLKSSGAKLDSVTAILRCMEANPQVDFGSPGPLVHFVERFYKRGYEDELVKSISRRPTSHTIWMLNRVINGAKEPVERETFMKVLKSCSENSAADEPAKKVAIHFLERLSKSDNP